MKKLFLPYKLALLSKEMNFDDLCFAFYHKENEFQVCPSPLKNSDIVQEKLYPKESVDDYVMVPLYQQIIDWFREKYDLLIDVYPNNRMLTDKKWWDFQISKTGDYDSPELAGSEEGVDDYYVALEKAIEEAFKLIKK